MIEVKAPNEIGSDDPFRRKYSVFLGGSIEMGKAEQWQKKLVDKFVDYPDKLVIYNPRRDDWDSSWEQTPEYGSKFHEQVSWELKQQDYADVLVYYFAGGTMSPITLLELGVYGGQRPDDTVVYVDDEFQRRGNVIMTCTHLGIQCTSDYDQFTDLLDRKIRKKLYQ